MPTWITLRDAETGHQFDVEARSLAGWLTTPGVERVDRSEPLTGAATRPRRAKHHTGLDGKPKQRKPAPPAQPPADDLKEQ